MNQYVTALYTQIKQLLFSRNTAQVPFSSKTYDFFFYMNIDKEVKKYLDTLCLYFWAIVYSKIQNTCTQSPPKPTH